MIPVACIAAVNGNRSASGSVPVNTVAPTIDNTSPNVGDTLTANPGTWTNTPTSFTYQWLRAGTPIGGATSSTYTTVEADAGDAISVKVVAVNASGNSAPATSAATAAVVPISAPANTVAPVIVSNADISNPHSVDVLTVSNTGTWTNTPTGFTYQWSRSVFGPIAGETNPSYTVAIIDGGATLMCTVAASNIIGSANADSNATGTVT